MQHGINAESYASQSGWRYISRRQLRYPNYQAGNPPATTTPTPVPATVLDPFVGSGTTVAVAQALGRRGVGLDLNPEYLAIAQRRIGAVPLPMF